MKEEKNPFFNKVLIKRDLEIRLLSFMLIDPAYASEIFGTIQIEELTDEHKILFEEIRDHQPFTYSGILQEIELYKPLYTSRVLDEKEKISYRYPKKELQQTIEKILILQTDLEITNLLIDNLEKYREVYKGVSRGEELKSALKEILRKTERLETVKSFDQSIDEILERIEKKIICDTNIKTISYPSFNTATGGLNKGNLIGIAGAFKNGKTSFGLNLILDFAAQNLPVAIFSLEMERGEIEDKILSHRTGISYEKLRNPKRLSEEDKKILARFKHQKENAGQKLFIYDRAITINEIEAKIKKLKTVYNLKIVLIDYLGLIKSAYKHKNPESREREISQLSNSLKLLAKETETSIIVLSQLNRSGLKEASSINLAESIGLARDCDFLFTIYKPELNGYSKVKMNGKDIDITEKDFIVKLDSSRHTQSGREFLLKLDESGKMKETDTRFDNSYLEKINFPEVI